jgi:hypothetical protein
LVSQRIATSEIESCLARDLLAALETAQRAVVISGTAPGAGRPLTDTQVKISDDALTCWVKERLLVDVVAGNCICGKQATNIHVHTCEQLRGYKTTRHNNTMDACGLVLARAGCAVTLEPRQLNPQAARTRPDIIISATPAGPVRFVGDLTIRFPAAASCLPTAATTQLHAAAIGEGVKDTAWAQWAQTCNADWAPLAMESTGGIATRFTGWMRRLCSNLDGPLTVSSVLDEAMAAILTACLEGTAEMFRAAAGAPTPQAGLRVGSRLVPQTLPLRDLHELGPQ